jgi:glycosyltransferase involved in cell wall biosynthesis
MSAGPSPRPALLVLTSTFPKRLNDTTPPFVFELCRHLLAHFDVTVLTPAATNAPEADTLQGIEVQRFHYFWPRSLERLTDGAMLENLRRSPWLFLQAPFLVLFELVAALRLARATRPDVIHAHWFVPQGIVAVLVGRILRIPVVLTAHGGDVYGLRGRLLDTLRKAVASRCDAVTVVSRDMATALPHVTSRRGDRPKVMPMGVDTHRFSRERARNGDSEQSVLFVGRLAKKKGVEYLIRGFPDVLARHPDARLLVVGDGPCRGELETLSRQLRLGDHIRFAGAQPPAALPQFYRSSRVFVLPSVVAASGDTDGLPVVLLEAMAAGCPLVGTSVGGIPDVMVHGRTGLLVEPGAPAALAAAINQVLDSPAEANRMGALAQRWVRRKLDWRQVARGYAGVLAHAAGNGERTGEPGNGYDR